MIHFQNITKKFGDRLVLDNIDLKIEAKELIAIIGPSGAGKSTLFNLLMGTIRPTYGNVLVDDLKINMLDGDTLQQYRRKSGIIFQDYKLLPQKTVYENIAFALEVCDEMEEDIKHRVAELISELQLEHVKNSFPKQLSGGEQQRVAIARALVHNPKIILADEPTGDLDPSQSREIINLIKNIHQKGTTVMIASHDQNVIEYLQCRVVKISGGAIVTDKESG